MGLVTSYLGVLWCGGMGRYCSTESFHRNHLLWITILSRYRSPLFPSADLTHTSALSAPLTRKLLTSHLLSLLRCSSPCEPSFCCIPLLISPNRRPSSQRKAFENGLDLSSLRHLAIGLYPLSPYLPSDLSRVAEPIRCASVEMFEAVFQKYGLSSEVIFPSYALAEHTALVCRFLPPTVRTQLSSLFIYLWRSNGRTQLRLDRKELQKNRSAFLSSPPSSFPHPSPSPVAE
jgi:hypothetical protein